MKRKAKSQIWMPILVVVTIYCSFVRCEIDVACPNGILVREHGKISIIAPGAIPISLQFSGVPRNGVLDVRSTTFSGDVHGEGKIVKGNAVVTLDYKKHLPIHDKDSVVVTIKDSPDDQKSGPVLTFEIYPIAVNIFHTFFGDGTLAQFRNEDDDNGRAEFRYSIQPWHDNLKNEIRFIGFPLLFCEGSYNFATIHPEAATGACKLRMDAKSPGRAGVTAVLEKPWVECGNRFSILIQFIDKNEHDTQWKLPPANNDDIPAIDQALELLAPEPHTDDAASSIAQLKTMLHDNGIPYCARIIQEFDSSEKKDILRYSGKTNALLQEFAERSLKFEPLPSKDELKKQ